MIIARRPLAHASQAASCPCGQREVAPQLCPSEGGDRDTLALGAL